MWYCYQYNRHTMLIKESKTAFSSILEGLGAKTQFIMFPLQVNS